MTSAQCTETSRAPVVPPRLASSWAYLLLVIAALCWAGNFVMGRAVHSEIPPLTLTFWRWVVAGALLLPLAGASAWRVRARLRRQWPLLALLAVSGVLLHHVFIYSGLQTTTATNAALMLATTPVIIPALSFVLLKHTVTMRQATGIAVSLAGVAVIVLRGEIARAPAMGFAQGDLWLLLAALAWALYSVLLQRLRPDVPRLAVLLTITGLGLLMLAPLYAWELSTLGGIALSVNNLLAVAYVGVFASVIAYICWNRGVTEVGPNKAGLFLHLMPAFATVLAILLLGESLQLYHLAGVAFIAFGIYLSTVGRRRPMLSEGAG